MATDSGKLSERWQTISQRQRLYRSAEVGRWSSSTSGIHDVGYAELYLRIRNAWSSDVKKPQLPTVAFLKDGTEVHRVAGAERQA